MARYRNALPQLTGRLFLTDGGLETTLVFQEGVDLPEFAAFTLLREPAGRAALRAYFDRYIGIAETCGAGFVLESVTWRANPDWGRRLGYSAEQLVAANRDSIRELESLRELRERDSMPMVISGNVGPRGDGYDPSHRMRADEAQDYHRVQIDLFAETAADMITAMTMNYVEEALGIVGAARDAGIPSVIAFTVETDGRLPTGQTLGEAIDQIDSETGAAPAYFMVNCAHTSHFAPSFVPGAPWTRRILGVRANASRRSHAELDESTELDSGDPEEFGREYRALRERFPQINVLGGCCGTDHRHVRAVADACALG